MADDIRIVEADSRALRDEFIRFPLRLYRDDPHYVAPLIVERREFLDPAKNPFFAGARVKLFLAYRGAAVVGRISTCIYFAHNETHNEQVGFFGFFDTIEDEAVAHALLKVALITVKQEGMTALRGPASFSTNHECGLLCQGFDSPPVVMMPYNRPYQVRFAESFGLTKAMDLFAYLLKSDIGLSERVARIAEKAAQRSGITVRPLNMKRFADEVDVIKDLYDRAWEHNWGFVKMSDAEFRHTAKQMKQILEPELALIAEANGSAVGFSLSLPNINQALAYLDGTLLPTGMLKLLWHTKVRNKIDGVRTLIMGVIPEYQKRGVDNLLHVRTWRNGVARGYYWSELSWVLETNQLMRSIARNLGAEEYKTYRMMEMAI
ncbi:MAG TPA: N-acetyltransferase [candidate division Zixibacteria bacterium]|nr:N-acetyltransferase [candidate division Zixibacteria bacterium]